MCHSPWLKMKSEDDVSRRSYTYRDNFQLIHQPSAVCWKTSTWPDSLPTRKIWLQNHVRSVENRSRFCKSVFCLKRVADAQSFSLTENTRFLVLKLKITNLECFLFTMTLSVSKFCWGFLSIKKWFKFNLKDW